MRPPYKYKAFISYSHAADGKLAPKLQAGLHRFAKPWYRLRAMRIFRDETSLSNTPELWPSIEAALEQSEYFLLLASPQTAASPWVKKEIEFWLSNRSKDTMLIVLTDGDLQWNGEANTFDWMRTTALPRDLDYPFDDVPRYTDLRELRKLESPEDLSLRNPTFLSAIADIASRLLGEDKDTLLGEDVRQHRRTKRITWSAVIALLVLTVASIVAAMVAVQNQREAERRRRLAQSRFLATQALDRLQDDRLDLALLLGLEAYDPPYTFEARRALLSALEAAPQLVTYLHSQDGGVRAVAFSPDGSRLATASGRTIRLWDAATFEPIGEPLTGHADIIFSLAFSPDGGLLASGGRSERNLLLWDVATGQALEPSVSAHRSGVAVQAVAFSPDGRLLASGGGDRSIVLWDIANRQPLGEPLTGHASNVVSLAFSPEGRWLASGSWDRTALLWEVETREVQRTLRDHAGQVEAVAFSPDGTVLATGSGSSIKLWDAATGEARGPALNHGGAVNGLAFSADGALLASGGSGSDRVILWDVARHEVDGPALTAHTGWINGLAFSPDGRTLASASEDGSVILWNIRAPPLGRPLTPHEGAVQSLALSPDGAMLAVGSCGSVQGGVCKQGEIRLWEVASGSPVGSPLSGHLGAIQSLAFDADGKRLISSGCSRFDGTRCTGIETRTWTVFPPRSAGPPIIHDGGAVDRVDQVTLRSGGELLAAAHHVVAHPSDRFTGRRGEYEIRLMDVAAGRQFDVLFTGHDGRVLDIAFSPDTKVLAASGLNGPALLWEIATGLPLFEPLRGHRLAFSPNGDTLVTVDRQPRTDAPNALLFWDAATGQRIRQTETAYNETILGVAWSHDGRTLALGGHDGTVLLWDVLADQAVGTLAGHTAAVGHLSFTPDVQTLVTGDGSGTVLLWDLSIDATRWRACRIASRNLSYAEWVQYRGDQPYGLTCDQLPIHPSVLEAGRSLARAGEVDSAIQLFQRALTLDSTLALDPQAEARQLAVAGLLERGRNLARAGNVEGAVALFRRVQRLSAELDLDPEVEAGKLAAPAVVATGRQYAERGMIAAARAAFARAQALDPAGENPARDWSVLCWFGSLHGHAADVVDACEQAVSGGSPSDSYLDSRGLARALMGDVEGAIADFQAYVDWWQGTRTRGPHGNQLRSEADIARLKRWIAALRGGENPLTPEEIGALRGR